MSHYTHFRTFVQETGDGMCSTPLALKAGEIWKNVRLELRRATSALLVMRELLDRCWGWFTGRGVQLQPLAPPAAQMSLPGRPGWAPRGQARGCVDALRCRA